MIFQFLKVSFKTIFIRDLKYKPKNKGEDANSRREFYEKLREEKVVGGEMLLQ